ncbi:MAG: hypothetical protein ACI84R_003755, partial [Candidatus Azotimanducaceae bacterium]
CFRIPIICASLYRAVFIKNLLSYLAEKILLLNTTNFRGDYHATRLVGSTSDVGKFLYAIYEGTTIHFATHSTLHLAGFYNQLEEGNKLSVLLKDVSLTDFDGISAALKGVPEIAANYSDRQIANLANAIMNSGKTPAEARAFLKATDIVANETATDLEIENPLSQYGASLTKDFEVLDRNGVRVASSTPLVSAADQRNDPLYGSATPAGEGGVPLETDPNLAGTAAAGAEEEITHADNLFSVVSPGAEPLAIATWGEFGNNVLKKLGFAGPVSSVLFGGASILNGYDTLEDEDGDDVIGALEILNGVSLAGAGTAGLLGYVSAGTYVAELTGPFFALTETILAAAAIIFGLGKLLYEENESNTEKEETINFLERGVGEIDGTEGHGRKYYSRPLTHEETNPDMEP